MGDGSRAVEKLKHTHLKRKQSSSKSHSESGFKFNEKKKGPARRRSQFNKHTHTNKSAQSRFPTETEISQEYRNSVTGINFLALSFLLRFVTAVN